MVDLQRVRPVKLQKMRRDLKQDKKGNEDLKIVHAMNERQRTTLKYHTYCLADKSQLYPDKRVKHVLKWANSLQLQIETKQSDTMDRFQW